ncbi:MAG TPA: hypothetical protein VF376_02805 [Thermoanaerobaculia bacterium]
MRRRALSLAAGLLLFLAARSGHAMRYGSFDLSVIVDGSTLEEYPHEGRTYVEAVKDRSFTLRVSNPSSERVAVAISVDGRNVIDAKRSSARGSTKWVLSPGQTIEIPGWQISGETARRFFFTDTAHSYASWLGDSANAGTIEAVFFREKRQLPRPITRDAEPGPPRRDSGANGDTGGSLYDGLAGGAPDALYSREASGSAQNQAPAPPSADAKAKDGYLSRIEPTDGLAATGIGERTSFPIEWIDFQEDPRPIARMALRYEYRRELVRLGVFPRPGDELALRERARGFQPEYAPDPDRHRSQ